jgi:hypothetical protein
MRTEFKLKTAAVSMAVALVLVTASGCSKEQAAAKVKKIPANTEFSGFLKTYDNLKPIPGMDGSALGYASTDAQKNLHKYIACVIDPVEFYLASNADDAKYSDSARAAVTEYFRAALVKAVSEAYPVVDQPGPLVMRLRAAIVGVDFGGALAPADQASDKAKGLTNMVNIGKVRVELELVDSVTGEEIAALVDKENLGQGVEIGATNLTREEKWASAREAFDGWAERVHMFLNASTELSAEDADRADKSYVPYGAAPKAK